MFFAADPIKFPPQLADALDRSLNGRLDPSQRARRGEALRALWPRLAKQRGQTTEGERHYSFRREQADAYAAYYLPSNCLKAALVLEEALLTGMNPVPEQGARWLDFGTGPGTAFWGLAWWFSSRGKNLDFTGWDQSSAFTSIARDLTANSPFAARADFLAGDDEPLALIRKLKPTHVSFVNSLAEIYPDQSARKVEFEKILRAMRELEQKDARERHLLLIEPGSRDSSRELSSLKDHLQTSGLGYAALPCMDNRACGALKDPRDWCHEEVACEFPDWLNDLGAEVGLRKEAMLFSYAWMGVGKAADSPLARGLRIVSQRMERKGQVECRLCTEKGKIAVRVQRSKADSNNEFFLCAIRGDLWKTAVIREKGDLERVERFPPIEERTIFSPAK